MQITLRFVCRAQLGLNFPQAKYIFEKLKSEQGSDGND
jgi:hypothetical protein